MASVEVREVAGKADMKTFIKLPGQFMKGDPHWVEPLHFERAQFFSPKHNPWFTHGTAQFFIAYRNGEPVGRISAQIDKLSPPVDDGVCGLFGSIASIDDQAVVSAMLDRAEAWLRENGASHMRGPYTLNINHEVGCLIDGFDSPPFLLMPHDPPYLGGLIEAWGLEKGRDLYAYRLDTANGLPEKLRRFFKNMPENVTIRGVDLKNWDQEVEHIASMFNEAWKENWGFVPFTQAEIDNMAKEMKPLIDPGLTRIAEQDGKPIGFIVLLPDVNEVIRDFNGKLFPFNVLRLLWRLKFGKIRQTRVPLMGVVPGLDPKVSAMIPLALIYSPEERYRERGFGELEFSWILEDNKPVQRLIEMVNGSIAKTYRVWEKSLR